MISDLGHLEWRNSVYSGIKRENEKWNESWRPRGWDSPNIWEGGFLSDYRRSASTFGCTRSRWNWWMWEGVVGWILGDQMRNRNWKEPGKTKPKQVTTTSPKGWRGRRSPRWTTWCGALCRIAFTTVHFHMRFAPVTFYRFIIMCGLLVTCHLPAFTVSNMFIETIERFSQPSPQTIFESRSFIQGLPNRK